MRAAPRLSWLPAWKLVSAKPSLLGSEGGSHGIETSCSVNISSKSPRISSEIPHTRGPNFGSKFLVYESRGKGKAQITTHNHLLFLPLNLIKPNSLWGKATSKDLEHIWVEYDILLYVELRHPEKTKP